MSRRVAFSLGVSVGALAAPVGKLVGRAIFETKHGGRPLL